MKKFPNKKEKLFSLTIILSFLVLPLLLISTPNNIKTTESDLDIIEDVIIEPKNSAIIDGTMTHTMFPIVISSATYDGIYEKLEFKDYSMIRIGYYSDDDEWQWVPYQIDEIGQPERWGDTASEMERATQGKGFPRLFGQEAYIPFGDPNGRGFDEYIPGKLDYNDELVFYAHNGRKVGPGIWGLPEYEFRIELEIQDGAGGTGWMYIYTSDTSYGNNSIAHESWYHDYLEYDEEDLEIETDIYRLQIHPNNYDIISSIKIKDSNDPTNLVDEFDKQNACNNLLLAPDKDYFYSTTEGTWGTTFHDIRNTALDDPSDEYNYDGERAERELAYGPTENNDISNKGDHKASCDGPIRIILQYPCFEYTESGTVKLGPINVAARGWTQGYFNVKYYRDRIEMGGGGDTYEVQSDADFCLLYKYNDIVSLNNDIKKNLTVYYGADPSNPDYSSFTNGLKTCIPDGNGSNDEYISGGNPLQGNSKNHPNNPEMGDWLMVTSDEFGGFWKYTGREKFTSAQNIENFNIYWKDTPDLTEMGMQYHKDGNGLVDKRVTMPSFTRTTIFGNFSSSNLDYGAILYNQQDLYQSNTIITHGDWIDKPNIPFFISVDPDQTSYKNGSKISLNIKCDDDNYTITGDFSEIDSEFDKNNMIFQNLGNNLYVINYTISSNNTKIPGKYYINLTADDGHPSSDNNTQQEYLAYYSHDEKFLNIESVVTQPAVTDVYPGQSYYAEVNITNPTLFDVTIDSLNLDFTYYNDEWGNAKTNFTNGSPIPALPFKISENVTDPLTFNLSFTLDSNTPPGLVSVNATIDQFTIDFTQDTFSEIGTLSPCDVNVIDNLAPNLPRRPGNLTLVLNSDPSYINWTWMDYKPAYYNITKDGDVVQYGTQWYSGVPIKFGIDADDLGVGIYNYTINVNDTSGNTAWNDVKVNISNIPIALSQEYDVIYTYGEVIDNLTWTPSWDTTHNPNWYIIEKDGVTVLSGSWGSRGITYNITGFWVGNYTIKCSISNDNGDWATDTVNVTVLNDIPEITSNHVTLLNGMKYVTGSIGNMLNWTISDGAYTTTKYNVTNNGLEYQTGTWVDNIPINVSIDELSAGTYNFSILVDDGLGGTVRDSVFVRVIANEAPEIDLAYDILDFDEGTTDVKIRWEIIDEYYNSTSCSYSITINSTLTQSGTWEIIEDSGTITYAFDNYTELEIGVYIFVLTVNDGYGGNATHQVKVRVNEKVYTRPLTLWEQLIESFKPFFALFAILYVGRVLQKRRRISVSKVKLVDTSVQSRRGMALEKKYEKKGKDELILDGSIRQFRYTAMIDPKAPEPHYNLAVALMEKGEIDESIHEFKKVIALKPDFAEAHNNLGIALANKGEFDEAIESFKEALKINPDFTAAKTNLEVALEDKDGEYWARFGVQ